MTSIYSNQSNPHLNAFSLSEEWETSGTTLAVLGIGACEQHGRHLPLLTDTLYADNLVHHVSESLNAAALPTIPIGTSMEHTSYRGSFSFRPETMMAIVRDLVDECERQGFTRLIILNGHGGNFSLGPVVRDINREDRSIKIILISSFMMDTSGAMKDRREHGHEIHAGCVETSRMMVIAPELVRDIPDYNCEHDVPDAVQSDLNLQGFGALRPSGVWGDPAGSNTDDGAAMHESIKANLVTYIQERLERLDVDPRYGGDPKRRGSDE